MNTQQINTIIKSDPVAKKIFLGTFPSDKLPVTTQRPYCFVANTHPSNKPGEHWVALHCDSLGHGSYMDSYGLPPQAEFKTYMKRNCKSTTYNRRGLQGVLSSTCGYYAIYCCLFWARGDTLTHITDRFDRQKKDENDVRVTHFINKLFDCSFPIYDTNFLVNQLSTALANAA